MDNSVALVRSYLYVNGYFTVSEYPFLEAVGHGGYREITDLDVLAVRFPGTGRLIPTNNGDDQPTHLRFEVDSALGCYPDQIDMLIAEVEGSARLNENDVLLDVLRVVLTRSGCCSSEDAHSLIDDLFERGETDTKSGRRIRLIVFSSVPVSERRDRFRTVDFGHLIQFLQNYLETHWDVLRHARSRDPALGFLMTMLKAERSRRRRSGPHERL